MAHAQEEGRGQDEHAQQDSIMVDLRPVWEQIGPGACVEVTLEARRDGHRSSFWTLPISAPRQDGPGPASPASHVAHAGPSSNLVNHLLS